MKKNRKKWVLAGLAVMTASALMLGGCGSANAANTARATAKTTKQVDMVVASINPINEQSFNFPSAFGSEFFVKEASTYIEPLGVIQTEDNIDTTKPEKTKNRSINMERKNRYNSRHFDIKKLNTENSARNSYYDRLDDLYILCADISAANEKINTRLAEIKSENTKMKKLSKDMKNSKKLHGEFRNIQGKNAQTKNDLRKLYKERRQINKQLKSLPKNEDNLNIDNMTIRYNAILNKLESRLQLLDNIKTDMSDINASMSNALNQNTETMTNQAAAKKESKQLDTTKNERKKPSRIKTLEPKIEQQENKPIILPEVNTTEENQLNIDDQQLVSPDTSTNFINFNQLRDKIRIQRNIENTERAEKPIRSVREENRRLERARRIDRTPYQQERAERHRQGRNKPKTMPNELVPEEVSQITA